MTPKEYQTRIIELVKGKKYKRVYEVVEEALTIYPNNLFFLKNEVFILYKLNNLNLARQKAEENIETLKTDAFFLRIYLSILEKAGAQEDIERMIEKNVFPGAVGNEEFHIFLAGLAERVFSKEKAEEILKRSIGILPESKRLKELLDKWRRDGTTARGYKKYKEKFKSLKTKDAIAELESIKVLPQYYRDHELHLYLAELYKKTGEYDKAIETYRYVLSLKDDEFSRKMLGYAYYKKGETENALVYLKDVFFRSPKDHFIYSTIYKIFEAKSDYAGFERLIHEVLSVNPDATNLYGLLKRARKW